MKLRMGFVSNSSTTSFCIFGMELDYEEAEKIILDKKLATIEEIDDNGVWEYLDLDLPDSKLEVHVAWPWDMCWIGKSYTSMGLKETREEFENGVRSELKELLGKDVECGIHEEAWRDG